MTLLDALPSETAPLALLQEARSGSIEALGELLEECRDYLLKIARRELPPPLHSKVDPADVVQETFIEATRDFANFRGETKPQLLGWLRGILRHNLADLTRHFRMGCRSLAQEVRLLDQLANFLVAGSSRGQARTICEQLIAQERCKALETAVQRLPPAYRRVLHLRYGERRAFSEIGNELQRSPEAVRKLVCRALELLRQEMHVYDDG